MATYPLLCAGGYPVPEKNGTIWIGGIAMHAIDVSLPSTLELTDATGTAPDPSKSSLFKWSRQSGDPENDMAIFPDIVKTRNGVRAYLKTNCDVYLYVS